MSPTGLPALSSIAESSTGVPALPPGVPPGVPPSVPGVAESGVWVLGVSEAKRRDDVTRDDVTGAGGGTETSRRLINDAEVHSLNRIKLGFEFQFQFEFE